MKLFEILKQQGLFSNDIKTRIKNSQISINGEPVTADIDLDVCLNSDILDKFANLGDVTITKAHQNKEITDDEFEEIFDMLSKFKVRKNDLNDLTFNDATIFTNNATILESGQFIADTITSTPIFSKQMKMFGFENLFDSNINSELTRYLNCFYFVKISKKDSFILKKK